MDIVKLIPAIKDNLWGGQRLREWGKKAPAGPLAECWELSFNAEGPSLIGSGPDKGKPLYQVATKNDIGAYPASFPFFPVLIKLIDAAENLSVQVHPDDIYAYAHERKPGKTEMWRIIAAEAGAGIYLGFKKDMSFSEVKEALAKGSILDTLNFIPVKAGEHYFIKSGTIHAIGAGVTLLEIQENSTITYRLYDYDRLDKNGQKRELHIRKALDVISYNSYRNPKFPYPTIGACRYFSSCEGTLDGEGSIAATDDSFLSFTILSGKGVFADLPFSPGDTFFVPARQKGLMKGHGVSYVSTEVKKR